METTLTAPFQRLSRDVVLYGLGSAALRLINFIFLPILTRIFSPAEYGTLETITSLIGIAGLIAELGLYSAAQRSFYDCAPDDRRGRILIISTGFWILLGWSVVLTLSLAGFANSNVAVWPLQELEKSIVLLALFTMPFPLLSVYLQETFRLE